MVSAEVQPETSADPRHDVDENTDVDQDQPLCEGIVDKIPFQPSYSDLAAASFPPIAQDQMQRTI
jgi:hypothetical protein